MSASTGNLLTLLAGRDPVGVVFYRDDESREDLLDLCELLAPKDRPLRETATVEDALQAKTRDAVLLITPDDEVEAVRTLEGRREELLGREAPAVLFLMQGGSAEGVLNKDSPALSSFLRGLVYDPEPPVNEAEMKEQRQCFAERHGRTANEWLEAWRRDEIEDTA
ncbi:MAG TPA: hypothetical protein VLS89_02035, partial [Candidatus Nanopelagicales bacterium]|nr:hypothetical protein [Candidatus Nanopelagicales bacterium]